MSTDERRELERTDAFWVGRFSMACGLALETIREHDYTRAKRDLSAVLAEFVASDVACEPLRVKLRRYLNK